MNASRTKLFEFVTFRCKDIVSETWATKLQDPDSDSDVEWSEFRRASAAAAAAAAVGAQYRFMIMYSAGKSTIEMYAFFASSKCRRWVEFPEDSFFYVSTQAGTAEFYRRGAARRRPLRRSFVVSIAGAGSVSCSHPESNSLWEDKNPPFEEQGQTATNDRLEWSLISYLNLS